MNRLGIAGAMWLVAGGSAIATTIIFRTDPAQIVVTSSVGVVAAILGVWLMARPNALAVSASNVVTVAWIALYAVLTVQQADEIAAWATDVFLILLGVVAGVAVYRAAPSAKVGRTIA